MSCCPCCDPSSGFGVIVLLIIIGVVIAHARAIANSLIDLIDTILITVGSGIILMIVAAIVALVIRHKRNSHQTQTRNRMMVAEPASRLEIETARDTNTIRYYVADPDSNQYVESRRD